MPAATSKKLCNGGKVRGYSLPINDSQPCYTSQLHVTVSPDMIGKSIKCVNDNGSITKEIGNFSIEECHATIGKLSQLVNIIRTIIIIYLTISESVWTGTAVYKNNTKSSTTMNMA